VTPARPLTGRRRLIAAHVGLGNSAIDASSGASPGGGRIPSRAARFIASYGERTLTSLSK